ncbi:hypothetical protein [Corynebacterium striatum]|uniref:hypothetical protein n=1 Tax=Corynebacterium striatum TaxID=43770 RepID=UPI000C1CC53D|nr:hypothetical protein AZH44_06630 [Corynebacterium striatum]
MGVPAASIAAPAAAIIELVGVIAAAGLMLVAAGPGMHSLDQLFFSKKAKVASKATTSQPLASPIEVRGIFKFQRLKEEIGLPKFIVLNNLVRGC